MDKKNIYDLTYSELTEWMVGRGYTKYRATQVWDYLYRKRVSKFRSMIDLKEECLQLLEEHFYIQCLKLYEKQESSDGTIKFLFELRDGHFIETVMMKYDYGISVCVTSQVGCNMGCSFCASGLLSKARDLSSGEIVGQIMQVQLYLDHNKQGEMVSNVVIMGIGEPFDNFSNVINFMKIILDHKGLAIPGRCITVSTSGIPSKIRKFAQINLPVNLAISLHAPNDEIRTKIMKINSVYSIENLMDSIKYYINETKRRVTIEYILLKDVNDKQEDALELASLLQDIKGNIYVNLIPYNPVDEHSQYKRGEHSSLLSFYDTLKKSNINCKIRHEHGADIDAACGQLRVKKIKEMKNNKLLGDIYEEL